MYDARRRSRSGVSKVTRTLMGFYRQVHAPVKLLTVIAHFANPGLLINRAL